MTLSGKRHVNDCADDLNDFADVFTHNDCSLPYFRASAPPTISMSSLVMDVWRVLLKSSVRAPPFRRNARGVVHSGHPGSVFARGSVQQATVYLHIDEPGKDFGKELRHFWFVSVFFGHSLSGSAVWRRSQPLRAQQPPPAAGSEREEPVLPRTRTCHR